MEFVELRLSFTMCFITISSACKRRVFRRTGYRNKTHRKSADFHKHQYEDYPWKDKHACLSFQGFKLIGVCGNQRSR